MKRIEENPSNYSAWHFRCELINKTITEANAESVLKEGGSALLHSCVELDLNLNGLYTECDDHQYFPTGCTKQQMENRILKILESYFRQMAHEQAHEEER